MNHLLNASKWKKSISQASSLRLQGNTKYQQRNDAQSLTLYTESIIHAPKDSEELSMALANRSAVLYHMKSYQLCLRDIELALQHGYPDNLKYKLILRRDQCLKNLGRHQEAIESLQKALEDISLDSNTVKKQDLIAALTEARANLKSENKQNPLPEVEIPVPAYGENANLVYASAALDLNCSCTLALYCSDDCRQDSWEQYHQWECAGGLDVMHSIGIAHLGLRVVLKAGPLSTLRARYAELKGKMKEGINSKYGNKSDNYNAVYHLMPHLENMQTEDLFQYATTATMLTLYLRHNTNYFGKDPDLSTLCLVGGLILRHIAQLVCNAHAITKLQTLPPEHEDQQVVTETQERIATAIYPTASMMNHSCDPSIINSFYNDILIVRACKDIPKEAEVFNCYGPHYRRMGQQERQDVLQLQYFFKCTCEPCSLSELQDFQ
ncbi:hypothetical protein L9F63_020273, partial [Diploptera punctata]